MTLANKITISRIFIAFIFLFTITIPGLAFRYLSTTMFLIAAVSDYIDGYIARTEGCESILGALLDPIADKLLITSALVSLVQLDLLPAWICVLIITREIAVMGLRLIAATHQRVLHSDIMGKYKTTMQLTAIIVILFFQMMCQAIETYNVGVSWQDYILSRPLGDYVYNLVIYAPQVLIWITLIVTVMSATSYFYRNRELLRESF